MSTDHNDPTEWVKHFDFTGETMPEGWEIIHGRFVPGVGIESVVIYKDDLEKRPDIQALLPRLKAQFWNRCIMTSFGITRRD